MTRRIITLVCLLVAGTAAVQACSYCPMSVGKTRTLTEDVRQAKFVIYGPLANPRLDKEGGGQTDVAVERVVKNDPFLANRQAITVNRYIPVDVKNPPRFLVFCDVFNDRVDAYRGVPIKSDAVVAYVKGALAIPEKERTKSLAYHFQFLDSPDPDVAADAFLEFARASDRDVGDAAPLLKPEKLRKLLNDSGTPIERLGLFAYLLGACGNKVDAELIGAMLRKGDERSQAALSGLLGGLIELSPKEGWETAIKLLRDAKKSFSQRLAVLSTMRFYHAWKPAESKPHLLRGLALLVDDGDMADMAIEDLRRWQWWDLTNSVLAQYGKPTHTAPLVRRAIIRYAMCCPNQTAADFVKARRALEPETVKEVEEGLEFERPAVPPKS